MQVRVYIMQNFCAFRSGVNRVMKLGGGGQNERRGREISRRASKHAPPRKVLFLEYLKRYFWHFQAAVLVI